MAENFLSPQLKEYGFITKIRVTYRDTDQMGFVYYANYLVWFEMARTEFLRESGVSYKDLEKEELFLPVIHVACNYKSPAKYDDVVRIETKVTELTNVKMTFEYNVFCESDNTHLAAGITKHVFINKKQKILKKGKRIKEILEKIL